MIRDALWPMIGAILGAFVTGAAMVCVQYVEQSFEDTRRMQLMAYEMAMKEWQTAMSRSPEAAPSFARLLLEHLEYSYVVRKYGADKKSEEFAGPILDKMLKDYRMDVFLNQALDECLENDSLSNLKFHPEQNGRKTEDAAKNIGQKRDLSGVPAEQGSIQ